MNPFENERKEIDEYSQDELEKLYGFDPRAYDNDFKEVEPMDDNEYMLFIAGVEPEDIEDNDDDPDDEPMQDPAVCKDGRCGPKYDDDFDVPEWPEWQEEDEIEEISTNESLTEDVLDEANPFKAIGKAVQKGFNKVTGKTGDLISIFTSFYIVASDLNGGNIRFLDKNGNTSKTAVTFNSLDEAKATAKNASNTAKCKAIVRGIANKTINNADIAGFSTKGDTTTAPLYVYVTGKETLDNTPKLIKSYANYRKQIGPNGDVDLEDGAGQGQGQGDSTEQGQGQDGGAEQGQGQGEGAGAGAGANNNGQNPPTGNNAGEGQGQTGGAGVTEDLPTKIKNRLKAYTSESVDDLIKTLTSAATVQATFEKNLSAAGNNVAKVQKAWRDLAAWYNLTTGKKLEKAGGTN